MSERPWFDRDIVLDTNVLIHLGRYSRTGEWLLATYLEKRTIAPIVSIVSVAEARVFAETNAWSLTKNETLRKVLGACIVRDVAKDDTSLLDAYRVLDMESRKRGHRMGKNDLWIAAECRRTGAVLLTCDGDFDDLAQYGEIIVDRYVELARVTASAPRTKS